MLCVPTNSDVIIREFKVSHNGQLLDAFALLIDGLVNTQIIDEEILMPIMANGVDVCTIPHTQVKQVQDLDDAVSDSFSGNVLVFVDTLEYCLSCDVKGFAARGVSNPVNEKVISGSQEAFVEGMRANTSLVRKIIRQKELMCELYPIGTMSKTNCSLMYISNIINEEIVQEIRRRLNGVDVDYLIDSGELEQLIEDFSYLPSPQILKTERPDRVATALTQGKAAIIVEGSPYVLILPTNFTDLLNSTEDRNSRFLYANLMRIVRIFGLALSLLLPAFFIALVNFHYDAIPTDLLFAILASRESMPFSLVTELVMLEIFFELIREAGLRVPSPIGSTIGIIGALIIGQAAVEANIVSPMIIIIVAITGVASYAIPSYFLSFSFRIMKYVYILFAAMGGFLGLSFVLFLHILVLCDSQSLNIPFLAPFAPKLGKNVFSVAVMPIFKREQRAPYLKTKRPRQQPRIARKWAVGAHKNEEE